MRASVLLALLLGLAVASCHEGPTAPSTAPGHYVATAWRARVWAGRDVDVLALGGAVQVELLPDGTTAGRLRFGSGQEIDLQGAWRQRDDTVWLTPGLGTMPFLVAGDRLEGRGLLGWFEVHYITLSREP